MITVAVTGGTGFIGRTLVTRHLERGDHVRLLTRRPGTETNGAVPFEGDLTTGIPRDFSNGADIVYHLAADTVNPESMHAVNALGTQRLLDATMGHCGTWVQLSSVGVYGTARGGQAIDEQTEPRPMSVYERSKLDADRRVETSCSSAGCRWCIIRPSNVVGPTMRNGSAFALVRAILSGRFMYIGSRDALSTYIHVEDVVDAMMMVASAPSGTVVNLSSDCPWTALVERVCDRAKCRRPACRLPLTIALPLAHILNGLPGCPLTPTRVEALARRGGYPIGHARDLLGFRPTHPMPWGFDAITDQVRLMKP